MGKRGASQGTHHFSILRTASNWGEQRRKGGARTLKQTKEKKTKKLKNVICPFKNYKGSENNGQLPLVFRWGELERERLE